jgi:hypothetical protein
MPKANEREVFDDKNFIFCGSCGVLISIETGEYVGRPKPGTRNLDA